MFRLLLDGDGPPRRVKLDDAKPLRVVHVVAEDRRASSALDVQDGGLQFLLEPVAGEDVIAQDHRRRVPGDEVLPDEKRLCQSVRAGLLRVAEPDSERGPVPKKELEARKVLGRGDDQDVPNARRHQDGERIVNHGLVKDGKELLRRDPRERVEPRPRAPGQDNPLHSQTPPLKTGFHIIIIHEGHLDSLRRGAT